MRALITGVSGTLGKQLLETLLLDGHHVTGYSRCEYKQSLITKKENLVLYLGDVRDRDRLVEASRDIDVIFHTAALKRIESCEENPEEAIATNVVGTSNVLHAQRLNKIPRVVFVSTDKATEPVTTYGYSKALGENLTLRNPNNIVVRYGNILASRGSVVSAFSESILKDHVIKITERQATRYWWTIEEAAKFVYQASQRSFGGLVIPELKASSVVALGKAVAAALGKPNPKILEIGFRCREKLHETMRLDEEGGLMISSDQSSWYTQRELEAVVKSVVLS
jgi:FlaA1/EpsC-like NDP-sugar epimerase